MTAAARCVRAAALALVGACAVGWAAAQTVSLAGSMGSDKALLVIDGQSVVLAVGASRQGVLLRSLQGDRAEVEVAGRRLALTLGGSPARLGGQGTAALAAGNASIVLPMGPGGHFGGSGQINGRAVQFMVDSGATSIALSQTEANRIGLDWKSGRAGMTITANGPVPVHAVVLSSVRLGGVEVANVAAVVLPAEMPVVLLGNSFLGRFTLRQDGDLMRLEKKP